MSGFSHEGAEITEGLCPACRRVLGALEPLRSRPEQMGRAVVHGMPPLSVVGEMHSCAARMIAHAQREGEGWTRASAERHLQQMIPIVNEMLGWLEDFITHPELKDRVFGPGGGGGAGCPQGAQINADFSPGVFPPELKRKTQTQTQTNSLT